MKNLAHGFDNDNCLPGSRSTSSGNGISDARIQYNGEPLRSEYHERDASWSLRENRSDSHLLMGVIVQLSIEQSKVVDSRSSASSHVKNVVLCREKDMRWIPRKMQCLVHATQWRSRERKLNIIGLTVGIGKFIAKPKVYLLPFNILDISTVPKYFASLSNINPVANHDRRPSFRQPRNGKSGEKDETTSEILFGRLTCETGPW
jgi:hypothetical protein